MKKLLSNSLLLFCGLLIISLFSSTNYVFAQDDDDDEDEVPAKLKYVKAKYEEFYSSDFQKVWDATFSFIENNSCEIYGNPRIKENDAGKQRGVCKTAMCIVTSNKDSTFKLMTKYALDAPFIRGGVWTSFRVIFTFTIEEQDDGKVSVVLNTELSGFEENATFKAHFFKSNGFLEFETFNKLKELIQ
jgi:hypothetical protein